MRGTLRLASIATAACTVAAVLGLAGPAHAIYEQDPIALAWNPAGPVHTSLAGNGVVYLGGKLNGTGGIAAVSESTGGLLWMVSADGEGRGAAPSPSGSTLYAGRMFTTLAGAKH